MGELFSKPLEKDRVGYLKRVRSNRCRTPKYVAIGIDTRVTAFFFSFVKASTDQSVPLFVRARLIGYKGLKSSSAIPVKDRVAASCDKPPSSGAFFHDCCFPVVY